MRNDETGPFDGELTAYLDSALTEGEKRAVDARLAADPRLRQRLEVLSSGGRPFREAYDALLPAAPLDRLNAALASALDEAVPQPAAPRWVRSLRAFAPAALAAGIALFVAGFGLGYAWHDNGLSVATSDVETAETPEEWREVVAQYLTLTTSQTLTALPRTSEEIDRDIRAVAGKLGVDLTRERIAIPDAEIARVDLYHYDEAPLAQITYLDEQNGPISLCIIKRAENPEEIAQEQRQGMNIAFWSAKDRAYMLVGRAPDQVLDALARRLKQQLEG
jgi:anti-sigma factor RsiW